MPDEKNESPHPLLPLIDSMIHGRQAEMSKAKMKVKADHQKQMANIQERCQTDTSEDEE